MLDRLRIEIDHDPRVHYAMHQCGVPIVQELRLCLDGAGDLEDLDVRIRIGEDLARPWHAHVDLLRAGSVYPLRTLDLVLDAERLRRLEERELTQLEVQVLRGQGEDAELLAEHVAPLELLAFREWGGLRSMPALLACYVLPNHPVVQQLESRVASKQQERFGRGALLGDQVRDPAQRRETLEATYAVLRELGLRYANPPASFEEHGQKLRLPGDVLSTRLATCLDLTLLVAGLFESIGLAPLLVLTEGHAFVGVWTVPGGFGEGVVDDPMRLRKRVDLGDVLVFETTALTTEGLDALAAAERLARPRLDDDAGFRVAIDVAQVRRRGVRPLPTRSAEPAEDAELPVPAAHPAAGEVAPAQVVITDVEDVVPPPGPGPATDKDPGAACITPSERRLEAWKRRLLDLTYRNRLLAFRESRRAIPLLLRDGAAIEDALSGRREFVLRPRPHVETGPGSEGGDPTQLQLRIEEFARDELAAQRLTTPLTASELDKRVVQVGRQYRASLEETGANTLHLAIGMLRYREPGPGQQERAAPLLLLPLEFERRSVREGWCLRLADDDAQVNATLLEKLRTEFGLDVRGLDELPEDDEGYDVAELLRRFRRAVVDLAGFEVHDEAWIAILSFQKFSMWRDLQARTDALLASPVAQHLIARSGEAFEPQAEFPQAADLDACFPLRETFCPLDADSSQLAAVAAARQGRSFVLEGPPGTGKSQTITNLIAQSLAEGRRVLFVSEKRAALEVVRERLGRVGLGPFCLELHSNKASKRDVLEQLRAASEAVRGREPEEWGRLAERAEQEREALNEYVQELHVERGFGESVFQVTSQLCGLRDVPRIGLAAARDRAIGRDWVQRRREAVGRLRIARERAGAVQEHPLAFVKQREWRATLCDDALAAIATARTALAGFARPLGDLATRLGFEPAEIGSGRADELVALAAELTTLPGCTRHLLLHGTWPELRERGRAAIALGRAKDVLHERVNRYFQDTVLGLELGDLQRRSQSAARAFWPLSWWRGRGVRPSLRPHLTSGARLAGWPLIDAELQHALRLQRERAVLADPEHDGAVLFGEMRWARGDADWTELESVLERAGALRAALVRLGEGLSDTRRLELEQRVAALACEDRARIAQGTAYRALLDELQAAHAAWTSARAALAAVLELDVAAFEAVGDWPTQQDERLASWHAALPRCLRDWVFWRQAEHEALELDLDELVDATRTDAVPFAALERVFERAFREAWWNATQDAVPLLRSFHSADHERRIASFRELDARAIALAREVVVARLGERVPRVGSASAKGSEMGILQRELRKKRRHLPVRRLFEQIPNLLARLEPCVLMSPLSVAQYLDPDAEPFDLVVFDEASQITVWDAIGALGRARAAIVVGDTRQLPPTSFFQRVDEEEAIDELDVEELESVLDECTAAGFRSLRLSWHYRSRHESLIAFSNYHYYDNRLHTFPSPVDAPERLGVSLVRVQDGVYDRAQTRTNLREAESVVTDLLARLRREGDERSHGIVTFSQAQQELVEDLLERERARDPELERFFAGGPDGALRHGEPVFVKNLENVQGDERDVILFSVCYGPDAGGKVALNFGPLNLAGGERRLNVAVTRARRQVIVHATLRPEQIDLTRTQATGVQHLRTFLEYAERGPAALPEAVQLHGDAARPSPFEQELAAALRARGHDVVERIGCSGYRIALGVRDPGEPERILLGIEVDGPFYRSGRTARDRDRIRPSVLGGLGWALERVWVVDAWRDPEPVLARLEARIRTLAAEREAEREAAERAAAEAEAKAWSDSDSDSTTDIDTATDTDIPIDDSAPPAPPTLGGELPAAEPADELRESEQDGWPDTGRFASGALAPEESVLVPESPASVPDGGCEFVPAVLPSPRPEKELFYAEEAYRLAAPWIRTLLEQEAPLVRERLVRRLAEAFDVKLTARARQRAEELLAATPLSFDGDVVWAPGQDAAAYEEYRHGGGREAPELPLPELANAAAAVLRAEFALPRDELAREMSRRFGFARMGNRVEEAMQQGIEALLARGGAREDEGRIVLP